MFPTDSITYETRKILSQLHSRNTGTLPPPPPYTTSPQTPLPTTEDNSDSDSDPDTTPATTQPPISITIDTSTRLVGHCNTLHLPHTPIELSTKLAATIALALKHAGANPRVHGERRAVDIRVQGGVSICGSRNTVVLGGGAAGRERGVRGFGGVDGGVRKPAGDASVKGREEGGQACASRKRRAESEPAEMPKTKKFMQGA